MNQNMANMLMSMLSGTDDKKLNEALTKAAEILNKYDMNEIKQALETNNLSKILGQSVPPEISNLIAGLPDSKKLALWQKFNSPEVQEALKTDKSKALEMLKQTIL